MRVADALAQADRPDAARGQEANRLFLEILTAGRTPRSCCARMNEAGVLGRFVPRLRPHRRDDAVQHVPPLHGGRASAALHRRAGRDRARAATTNIALANELMQTIQPPHRALLYVALFLHDIAKGRIEDHSIAGARIARRFCPRLGLSPAETETVAWLVEQHLVMSTIAQSRDLSDRKTIENFAAVVQSLERLKLLLDPHHRGHPRGRARRVERLEGAAAAHALLRDRAGADRRLLGGRPRAARRHGAGRIPRRAEGLADGGARRLYRAALSGLLAQGRPAAQGRARAASCKSAQTAGKALATERRLRHRARRHRADRARARPSAAALDHRRRLRGGGRQHRRRADLHHHRRARARHHRGVARVRARRGRGAPRGAHRGHRSSRRLRGELRLPDVVGEARRTQGAGSRPSRSSPR